MMNLEEIPPGYRFNPTDEEIITYYLRMKAQGEDMTWFNHVISEQDLYGEFPPWVFFQDGGNAEEDDHIRYFYTKLKKKHESGEKIHRTLGKNGEYCWDGQDQGTYIYDHRTKTAIGKKKLFSLIRSNKKKGRRPNSNIEKGKKSSSSSKDIHVDDGNNESFGNWIMHQYSLVNYPSNSSKDKPKYVICRIRMKAPPKPTTTGGNATTHRHDSINSSTAAPALSSCSTHGYQNLSNQMLHDHQQQQDYFPDADPPPLVLPIEADYQINHQDQSCLLQQHYAYDDQLMFQQDEQQQQQQQQQQQLLLMYDQEHSLAAVEALLNRSMSEWESHRLDNGGGGTSSHDQEQAVATMKAFLRGSVSEWESSRFDNGGCISSSHDQIILDNNNNINHDHDHDQLLQVDNFSANMEVVPSSVLLSNSMVDQEEENRFIMNNGGGHGTGGGTTSDHLDYNSTTKAAAGGVDNLDNGQTGLANYDTIMNSNNGRTGLTNYDTIRS